MKETGRIVEKAFLQLLAPASGCASRIFTSCNRLRSERRITEMRKNSYTNKKKFVINTRNIHNGKNVEKKSQNSG